MGDGINTPLTREDVLELIEKNGGTPKGLDLSGRRFEEAINLGGLDLKGITLDRAVFPVKFEGPENRYYGAILDNSDLRGASLRDVDFKDVSFSDTKLEGAFIQGADGTDAYLGDADWGKYKIGEELQGDRDKDKIKKKEFYRAAEHRYRHAKIWYAESGYYDTAGEFFFREMEAKKKQVSWRPNPIHRGWLEFVSFICGHGERPYRVVRWAALFIFVSSIVYYLFGGLAGFWDSLYFSAVSFTAIGYGSWINENTSNLAKWVGVFESFFGVFTIALFLVTFTRKMRR